MSLFTALFDPIHKYDKYFDFSGSNQNILEKLIYKIPNPHYTSGGLLSKILYVKANGKKAGGKRKKIEKISNKEGVREERNIFNTIENRREQIFGHLFRNDEFLRIIIEGKNLKAKQKDGRLRMAYRDWL